MFVFFESHTAKAFSIVPVVTLDGMPIVLGMDGLRKNRPARSSVS
jgi:hypothetical protein